MLSNGTQRPHRILRNREVRAKAGFPGSSTLYKAMERDGFPRPISIGARSVGWLEDEVDAWIEARAAKRDDPWRSLGDAATRAVEKVRP
jgi:prophage regulatory protein